MASEKKRFSELRKNSLTKALSDGLTAPPVDAKVIAARPGGRLHVYQLFVVIEEKFHVVYESKQERAESSPDVDIPVFHYLGPLETVDNLDQSFPGCFGSTFVSYW